MNKTTLLAVAMAGVLGLAGLTAILYIDSPSNLATTPNVVGAIPQTPLEPHSSGRISPIDDRELQAEKIHRDLRNAAQQALALPPGVDRDNALRLAAQTWGKAEPAAALAWANALKEEAPRSAATAGVCYGLASVDPEAAVHLVEKIPQIRESGILENLAFQWAEKDEAAAAAWVARQPGSPNRDQLIQRIAFVKARTDPGAAASLVVAQMPPGDEQTEAVITVVSQWARKDPAAAQAWVAKFPEGVIRSRAIDELKSASESR